MNKTALRLTALAVALSLTAACGSRRPNQLPPPPGDAATTGETGSPGAGDQSGAPDAPVPGSQADFLRSVPSDRVFFDTDVYALSAEARATLDAQVEYLLRYPNVSVTIEGHADERGTREYNLALGDRRANSVRNYLESRGVAAGRMTTISWGKERPAVEGSTEEAWSRNRRAVTVLPN
ncbi:MAG TPA: peptidoglycan-associated lipoprotein Pal [Allosphingosinicella sp.]|nr:peptidoglycan-associated lipoprotein Pal [Allosphingosinicella sp.]